MILQPGRTAQSCEPDCHGLEAVNSLRARVCHISTYNSRPLLDMPCAYCPHLYLSVPCADCAPPHINLTVPCAPLLHSPHGRYRHTERGPKPLVLLHHGVTLASSCFVIYNANESMAFILADAGEGTWLVR